MEGWGPGSLPREEGKKKDWSKIIDKKINASPGVSKKKEGKFCREGPSGGDLGWWRLGPGKQGEITHDCVTGGRW